MKKTISFEKKIEFPTMIGEISAISLEQDLKFIDESNVTGNLKISGRYKMTEASRIEEDFNYQLPVEIILTEKLDLDTSKVDIEDFYYEIENDDTMICYIDVKVEGIEIIDDIEKEEQELIDLEEIKKVEDYNRNEILNEQEERCIEEEPKEPLEDEKTSTPNITEPSKMIESESQEKTDTSKEESKDTNDTKDIKEGSRECDDDYNIEMESEEMPKEEKENQTTEINQEVGSLFSSFKDSDETFATYSVYILRQEETIQTVIEKYHTTKEELEKYNDLTNLTIGTKLIIPTQNE